MQLEDYRKQLDEIDEFCRENNISRSYSSDSYYFTLNGVNYRVSNHSVESSTYKDAFGNQHHYHGDSDEYREEVFCIHAGKTRIIEIYNTIKSGHKVDHRGNRID